MSKLIREGSTELKMTFERLLHGETIRCPIDEQIVYGMLDVDESAVWSLLLASSYLKVLGYERAELLGAGEMPLYDLTLTNHEVAHTFYNMVRSWFAQSMTNYNGFVKALLRGDVDEMNAYMSRVTKQTFSYFD